jgi:hypothetical protein
VPVYQCDLCQEEQAVMGMHNQIDGSVQFVGPNCLPLVGLALVQALPTEVLDGALKQIGYQPSKALRDERKAAEVPEYDAGRTIGEVVESAPRIDTGAVAVAEPAPEADEPAAETPAEAVAVLDADTPPF